MTTTRRQYEVVSVSLPRDLVKRANAVIPKARRSRVITSMLSAFLDSVERKQLERDYAAYYNQRSEREAEDGTRAVERVEIERPRGLGDLGGGGSRWSA